MLRGILLSLLLFVCLCGFCKNPVSVRAEEIVESAPQIVDLNDTTGVFLPQARSSEGVALADLYDDSANWYGNQLTTKEQIIYNALVGQNSSMKSNALASLTDDTVSCDFTMNVSSLGLNINDDDYNPSVVRAIHAYIRDYGEIYWVTSVSFTTTYGSDSGDIISIRFSPVDYYSGVREDIELTDTELKAAVQKIAGYNTDYEKVKAAHDYVIELITYGNDDLERAHTITGGLLEKYDHTAVCECYAKLFRLLCTKNDIPCVLITGGSTTNCTGDIVANHMWNYVQLNGYWYLVDCTWDDDESGTPSYTYFLAGANTMVTSSKTALENHMPVGEFSSFTSYSAFSVPTLGQETYGIVQEISLDQTTLTLDVGNTGTITATALPASATEGTELTYQTSDSTVAEVDENGKVTAKSVGTAEITVYSKDYPSIKTVCAVTVQEHEWVEAEVLTAPTCIEEGESKFKCSHTGCSKTKTETVPATGVHLYGELESVTAATCTTDGSAVKTCQTCNTQETVTIPATGHSYGDWTVTSAPTTGKDGEQIRYCQNEGCSESETRSFFSIDSTAVTLDVGNTISITAIGGAVSDQGGNSALTWNSSNTSIAQVSSAGVITAMQAGEAKIIATGDAYPGIEITCTVTVKDHNWDSGEEQTAATCTGTGTMKYTCTNDGCSAIKMETISATGHQFVAESTTAATCTTAETTTYRCTHTGCTATKTETTAAAKGHTGAWQTVQEATAVSTGLQEYRCTVCGELLKSKTIAKLTAKVKLNVTSLPMQVKKSTTVLKVDSMTTGDSVASWTSSNTKIVSVNSKTGKLTAKKKGTATITVTMKSGAKATCRITVQKGTVKTTKLTVKPGSVTLAKGKSVTLSVTRTPLTSGQKVTYKSSNKKVATVNSKGKITAKKKGTTTITVTSGSKKKKIKVTVK